ncbi:hypothetical protein Vadar_023943 [Vaccinium darrowii]|uniref:Uncharacterized protein n=1 Tax=Vaccinium darrowii TaxID=229202 RepID=A0ACB7YPC8_9ERIC|nr:hypothetical protein Vadar_023943 [Vaccinium darrowii]
MESSILLLCKCGSFTLVVKVATGFRFENFIGSILRKWNELVSRRFNLLYVVSEHRNCVLENDDDFDNMLALATAYGVSCVEVYICVEEIQSSGCFDHVREKSSYRPIDAVKLFERRYGATISYNHAWLGVEKASNEISGDYVFQFDQLRWYADIPKEKNLGSVVDIECCEDNRFRRYKCTLLAAVGKDANQGLFPLAYGIVDSETDDNWLWFLIKLKGILSTRELSIITDRHTGLVKHVPEVFSNCYHAYCLEHLKNNLRDRLR